MDEAPFDPSRLIGVLLEHGVSFVVIGGVAGNLLGSPTVTHDLDVCYERSRANLEALAAALRGLRAERRGVDAGLPVPLDARGLLLGDSFTFATDAGPLDCLGTPSGTGGYADLARKAARFRLGELEFQVVSLDDLIRMKRAAGRAKDRIELEILGALRDELDGEAP
ncbi:MAG TPA: hypothetical protein VG370_34390 [Chloroflexota bacterium]|nr:hypothetical protein [Chloroflexota bacterium]